MFGLFPRKKRIELSRSDYEFLKNLKHELTTQGTDGNAQPVFWGVMESGWTPVPDGCGDAFIIYKDARCELGEVLEIVDEGIPEYDEDIRDGWGCVDRTDTDEVVEFLKEYVDPNCRVVCFEKKDRLSDETGAFLTKKACRDYIDKFGYNHYEPRTYAMTAYRNFELERLLKILSSLEFDE